MISLNVKRRNLNAAQRAIAAADAWLRAEAEGHVQKQGGPRQNAETRRIASPRDHFAKLFAVNEKYVEMARDLLLDDPVGARRFATALGICPRLTTN
ncbi:MAG: hypothetical protein ACREDL_08085 [Bradyrhizobium sp.]